MPDACTRTSPMICDMWLSACKSLGFPCTVEGIARLHRAAYVCVRGAPFHCIAASSPLALA